MLLTDMIKNKNCIGGGIDTKVDYPGIYIWASLYGREDGNLEIKITARHNDRPDDILRAVNEIKEMVATIS